jgi:hypothetical protein
MAARDRFTQILRQNAPGGGLGQAKPRREKKSTPVRKKKPAPAKAAEPKGPKEGENVDALEKMISGAAKRNRVDDVIDSTLSRADAEANKPKTGEGSRTPIRREYPAEEIRDLIATPEGLAELKRHIGDDPGNKKQKAIRAALYARNQSWADDFDLALAGETPAPKLDAGFEGVGAGEGAKAEAAEGDGVYISPPADPPKRVAAEKDRGETVKTQVEIKTGKNKGKLATHDVHATQVGDVTLVRKRLGEDRDREARLYKDKNGKIRAGGKTLSTNLKNAYAQLQKWYKQAEKDGLTKDADGTVVYSFEEFANDYGHKVTGTKIVDDTKVKAKAVDGNGEKRRGYPAQSISSQSQAASQRGTATRAAGFDPAAPEGFSAGAAPEDVVPVSEYSSLRQRSTQPASERQDAARRLMDATFVRVKGQGTGSDQVLSYLRKVDDDTALQLAYKISHDALIDRIPTAERATAVADHDAVHGVVQGLFEAAGRKMPTTMPEWYINIETTAQQKSDAAFGSKSNRTGAQPSRVAPASAPLPLPNKRFDPTINAQPELDPKPTLPVTQRPQGKVPKNIEEELAAYHAGEITDPDQKAYLEDIIETRRQQGELFRESEKARVDREKAAARAKTRVNRKSQNTVLPESSDVTVAEAATTPGDTALNEGTDMASKKSTVVDVIAGKTSGKKAGPAIAKDTVASSLDADSGVKGARKAAGDTSTTRGQASLVPLTERYTALAEDARNADPSMAAELNERLATLDAEILKLGEKAGTAHFEAAGAAEDAVKRLGAPAAKPAAATPPVVGTKPAAGKRGKAAAAEPAAPAATEVAAPAPKPEAPKGTQVGIEDDAVGGDGNLDVTAKPRRTRVRTKEQPDTSEMEASRMADEGGMHPVGPNPRPYERTWDEKRNQLDDAAYEADLARRQRAVRDAEAQKVAAEQARRDQYSSQWDEAGEAVDAAYDSRVRRARGAEASAGAWDAMGGEAEKIARARRGADAAGGAWDAMGGEAERLARARRVSEAAEGSWDAMGVEAEKIARARRGAEASADAWDSMGGEAEKIARARRVSDAAASSWDAMGGEAEKIARARRGADAAAGAWDAMGGEARRIHNDYLTDRNGDMLDSMAREASANTTARMTAEADRIRMQRALIGAAAAAGAGGVYAQTEAERPKAPAPAEPPEQVPDRPTETQVGLPDDGPDLMPNGDPEDVSIDAPPPPGRRLPPGYRAPQAARYQSPPEEELVLANPNRDDLVLPDPHAGRDLFLPDPNAGRVSMGTERATNSDDPRAKLSRLMKALGR